MSELKPIPERRLSMAVTAITLGVCSIAPIKAIKKIYPKNEKL